MSNEEKLTNAIAEILEKYNLDHEVILENRRTAYYIWVRKVNKIRRHIWIRTIPDNEYKWEYGVVWGEYPAWEDYPNGIDGFNGFDSRTFGKLDFILKFFTKWMIEFIDWKEMPSSKESIE